VLAAVLGLLDLPTRRAHEPELGGGDVRVAEHHRIELVQRQSLSGWLHDDKPARIA
jgi:hypothetical protein